MNSPLNQFQSWHRPGRASLQAGVQDRPAQYKARAAAVMTAAAQAVGLSAANAALKVSSSRRSFTHRYHHILYRLRVAPNGPRPWTVGRRDRFPAPSSGSNTPAAAHRFASLPPTGRAAPDSLASDVRPSAAVPPRPAGALPPPRRSPTPAAGDHSAVH